MAIKRNIRRSFSPDEASIIKVFDKFIEEKIVSGKSDATITTYKKSFRRFYEYIEPEENDIVRCSDINADLFYSFMADLKNEGLRPASINHYMRDLKAFVKWCQDEDREYMKRFKMPLMTAQEELPKTFDDGELDALLKKPDRNADFADWRMWCIVNFIYATGARSSTLVSITMNDIDLKKKKIVYPHTKNNKAQQVNMSSELQKILREYIGLWRSDAKGTDYLFCNYGNDYFTTSALRQAFTKYAKKRNVNKTSLHAMRHTFAKYMALANAPMVAIQQMLGHKTLEMTRHYIEVFASDLEDNFDSYNPLDLRKKAASRTKAVSRSR